MAKRARTRRTRTPRARTAAKPVALDPTHDLERAAAGVEGARMMVDVPPVRCIPTILPGLDRILCLPGWPLGTIAVVHGPTADGKSAFAVALMISFQRKRGVPVYWDAELAADLPWFGALGLDLSRATIKRPTSYEEIMEGHNQFFANVRAGIAPKAKKGVKFSHPDISFISVLDSMSEALPQEVLDAFGKDDNEVRGTGRLQAAWNKHFVNVVNPSIHGLPIAEVVILHEGEGEKKGKHAPIRVKGGNTPRFQARIQLRVKRVGFEKVKQGDGEVRLCVVHAVQVWKNKLGHGGGETKFFTATADGIARGIPQLDLGRSLFESAKDAGLVVNITETDGRAKKLVGLEVGGVPGGMRLDWVERFNSEPAEFERVAALVRATPLEVGARGGRGRDGPVEDEGPSAEKAGRRGDGLLPPSAFPPPPQAP